MPLFRLDNDLMSVLFKVNYIIILSLEKVYLLHLIHDNFQVYTLLF